MAGDPRPTSALNCLSREDFGRYETWRRSIQAETPGDSGVRGQRVNRAAHIITDTGRTRRRLSYAVATSPWHQVPPLSRYRTGTKLVIVFVSFFLDLVEFGRRLTRRFGKSAGHV